MENEMASTVNFQPGSVQRLISAIVPVLFVAISYVDPGKWAAAVEGGARYGYDFIIVMLVFNFVAILCQYLSARVAVVTGKDLAQICSEEYDKVTCIFLGVQAELSMIALDLAMLLGTAHGLNALLGADLLTCVFLMSLDAALFPVASTFLENGKSKMICICVSSFILISYLFGVLLSQPELSPEIPMSTGGTMLTKLSGESVFVLMTLLGANIMPHNFYLHSSIVQQDQRPANVSKGTLCHDHFLAILCIFSGIFLVNYVLMNSAADVFHSTGLALHTFRDTLNLMDQVSWSLMATFGLVMILVLSNHVSALSWKHSGQTVLNNLFNTDIPGWLHHSTIRILAIVPAVYSVYNSSAEGLYQLLIFTQIITALSLPSSVIPLFRIASSRSLMGPHKVSQFLEFAVLTTFLVMLGLEIIFVIEMIFGNSDWARGNVGTPFLVLLLIAIVSLCLMLWLAATPLKSASMRVDAAQVWTWDPQALVVEPLIETEDIEFSEPRYRVDEFKRSQETEMMFRVDELKKTQEPHTEDLPDYPALDSGLNLPDSFLDTDTVSQLSTIEESEKYPIVMCQIPKEETGTLTLCQTPKEETGTLTLSTVSEVSDSESTGQSITSKMEETEKIVTKREEHEEDLQVQKDEAESWDVEEPISKACPTLSYDGPGSYKSIGGKVDDFGSGPASLSRLAGLGRAARRQLAAALDEFWGQLFDFHGKLTNEAKTKKLDMLLGFESNSNTNSKENLNLPNLPSSVKLDPTSTGFYPSIGGGRLSDALINASLYESPRQQSSGLVDSPYATQRGSSSLSSMNMQLLKAYALSTTQNTLDSGERRYSSLRHSPSNNGYIDQTAAATAAAQAAFDAGERLYSSLRLPTSGGYADQPANPNTLDSSERRYASLRLPVSGGYVDQPTNPNTLDSSERRYASLRLPASGGYGDQPTTPNALDSGERRYASLRLPASGGYSDQPTTPNTLDSGERRYSSLRMPPVSDGYSSQPATVHGYQLQSYINRLAKERNVEYLTSQLDSLAPNSPSRISSNYRDPFFASPAALGPRRPQNGITASKPPGFPDLAVPRNNNSLQPERSIYDLQSGNTGIHDDSANTKKYHSLPDISGMAPTQRDSIQPDRTGGVPSRYGPSSYGQSLHTGAPYKTGGLPSMGGPYSLQYAAGSGGSMWSREPLEQFCFADKKVPLNTQEAVAVSCAESESKLLQSFRHCIVKLLKLEGSDWLFRTNDGADEDLIDRVAAREKFYYEAETRMTMNRTVGGGESESVDYSKFWLNSVPNCGDDCIWRADLIVSFGVWCIHRVLELSLMESRPELWGKYTYVLNRLQGMIEPAFSKARTPMTPCFCLQVPAARQQLSPSSITSGSLPPPSKHGRGKLTNAAMLLDIIKDVETAISCRKGRTGTAAGDVAFPKGKENLVSVLKRYKRRLSTKAVGPQEGVGPGPRRVLASAAYGS
jgi:ethylene-insensitive protein 2